MIPDDRLPRFTAWKLAGPTPLKRQHCGYCSSLTEKQKRKLDSCPECGKSLFAFRKRKFR